MVALTKMMLKQRALRKKEKEKNRKERAEKLRKEMQIKMKKIMDEVKSSPGWKDVQKLRRTISKRKQRGLKYGS